MKSLSCLVLASVFSFSVGRFHCGPGSKTGFLEQVAKFGCSQYYVERLSVVCFKHDNCYSCQKGQSFCDSNMCTGLQRVVSGATYRCKEVARLFCDGVKAGGAIFYKKADRSSCNPSIGN